MPSSIYQIAQLLGQNRNAAEGEAEQNPVELFNLIPTRMGGWQTRGYERVKNPDVTYPETSGGPTQPFFYSIGYEHRGYSSFYEEVPNTSPTLYRFSVIEPSGTIRYSPGANLTPINRSTHLPSTGALGWVDTDSAVPQRRAFLIKRADDTYISDLSGIPLINTIRASISGSTLTAGFYRLIAVAYITTDAGKVAVAVSMHYVNLGSSTGYNGFLVSSLPEGVTSGTTPDNFGTEVYLARDPITGKFNDSWGNRDRPLEYVRQGDISSQQGELEISTVQFGPTINIGGYGFPMMANPGSSGGQRASALHNQRLFFVAEPYYGVYTFRYIVSNSTSNSSYSGTRSVIQAFPWKASIDSYTPFTVGWTEQGFTNLYNPTKNYYTLPAKNSQRITAFVSIQDGMLVFCDNECFLMRGDPAYAEAGRWEDFNFTPYMPMGCDYDTVPGILGPEVYVVWRGEVYQVASGQMNNISKPLYDRTDPFIQVVGDAEQSAILCLTRSGKVYAFYPEYSHWTQIGESIKMLIPTPNVVHMLDSTRKGLKYLTRAETSSTLPASARAVYRTSLGDKHRRKMLKRVRIPVSDRFSGTVRLGVAIEGAVGQIANIFSGQRYDDDFVFAIPLGFTAYEFVLTFYFDNMRAADVIEGPIDIEFVDRGQKR